MKKYFWKKKSSMGNNSPSPKKEESGTPLAKIVTFNFSLRPIECKGSSSALRNEEKKGFSRNQIDPHTSAEIQARKQISKPYEFSETFKRTFMSVQK